MITACNTPNNTTADDDDFTLEHYRCLLQLAKKCYKFADYRNIPFGEKFILWRHDCDFSLNRAVKLARIEHEEGVKATYFLNPHCRFYNLLEAEQVVLVREILRLGHDIGLHFDAAFYNITSETQLEEKLRWEAMLLKDIFGTSPAAFSFHNPTSLYLSFEAESYGNLVNCYSKHFKTQVPYCSDSNGYWRFRRLYDVLKEGTDPCLQVLTHPGWWQDSPMPPRRRIFRCIYGRAASILHKYDSELETHGRMNHNGNAKALRILKKANPRLFELCDYLWNAGYFETLFIELSRLHEWQISNFCKVGLLKMREVLTSNLNVVSDNSILSTEVSSLFKDVFGIAWYEVVKIDQNEYNQWILLRNVLTEQRCCLQREIIEQGCVFFCNVIESLASWGDQSLKYDGLREPSQNSFSI